MLHLLRASYCLCRLVPCFSISSIFWYNPTPWQNKVNLVTLSAGAHSTSLQKVKQNNLDLRFVGWVTFDLEEFSESKKVMTIDVKGPDSHLRVRQIKVLGVREGDHMPGKNVSSFVKCINGQFSLKFFPKMKSLFVRNLLCCRL